MIVRTVPVGGIKLEMVLRLGGQKREQSRRQTEAPGVNRALRRQESSDLVMLT